MMPRTLLALLAAGALAACDMDSTPQRTGSAGPSAAPAASAPAASAPAPQEAKEEPKAAEAADSKEAGDAEKKPQ